MRTISTRATRTLTYLATALDGKEQLLNLHGALLGFNHEETREAFYATATLHLRDVKLPNGTWLSTLAGIGARVFHVATLDGTNWLPVFEGQIWEHEPDDREFTLTAHDPLFKFSDNDDQVVFEPGVTGAHVLRTLFTSYGLPIGTIAGPKAEMPRIVHDGKDGELAMKVLQHGLFKGEKAFLLRWKPGGVLDNGRVTSGHVEVVEPGINDPVFSFVEGRNVISVKEHQNGAAMIQEVVVLGSVSEDDDSGRAPIEQRIRSKNTRALGGRAVIKSSDYDSPEAAKKAAETMLEKNGVPDKQRSATTIDVETVRKADIVKIHAGALSGYYTALSVSHDPDAQHMDVTLAGKGTALYEAAEYAEQSATLDGKTDGTTSLDLLGSGKSGKGSGKVAQVLAWCRSHLGIPYVWGGGRPVRPGSGTDCSGFVASAFNAVGLTNFGWGSTDSMMTDPAAYDVPFSQRRPGDIVLFEKIGSIYGPTGHVGIIAENVNQMYNAGDPSQLGSLSSAGRPVVKIRRVRGTE